MLEDITQNPDGSLCLGIINFRGLRDMADVLPQSIRDKLLLQLTQTLKEELRGRDIVGRWGASQLAVLLPSTPSSALESTFTRIKARLSEAMRLDATGEMVVRPDPCIGVASHVQFESDKELIKRAELAVEKASALNAPSLTILSRPFVFVEDEA
jgi:diguanylate cyclase (GGDEF)-like protein